MEPVALATIIKAIPMAIKHKIIFNELKYLIFQQRLPTKNKN
jgi:hypothetical protein